MINRVQSIKFDHDIIIEAGLLLNIVQFHNIKSVLFKDSYSLQAIFIQKRKWTSAGQNRLRHHATHPKRVPTMTLDRWQHLVLRKTLGFQDEEKSWPKSK